MYTDAEFPDDEEENTTPLKKEVEGATPSKKKDEKPAVADQPEGSLRSIMQKQISGEK